MRLIIKYFMMENCSKKLDAFLKASETFYDNCSYQSPH